MSFVRLAAEGVEESDGFLSVSLVALLVALILVLLFVPLLIRQRRERRERHQHAAYTPTLTAPGHVRPHEPALHVQRFTPLEELGRGGMGVVWRARDTVLGREVAIKQLLPPAGLAPGAREVLHARMLREARAAARLDHRNAVTVHDVLVDRDSVLIVMELVRARTLSARVTEDGPLPPARVAAIGLALLDVLEEAHRLGIVHRDLKPANVLLRGDGSVALADFGIARFAGDPTLTDAGAVLGTPAYMAPEQIRGLDSTPATDLWGLGATLYFAAEGEPAFGGPTPTAAMAAILTDPPRPPVRAGSVLGPLLAGLLAKDSAERPGPGPLRSGLERLAPERR